MDATLVIMAAGLGSRYGGVKQIEGMGPNGEILMEYSIHDAVSAGFNKVVFIIKDEIYDDVRELCGDRTAQMTTPDGQRVKVEYAVQSIDKLTKGSNIPPERTKPLGTVHAVLCAKDCVKEPFAVINADDYYGIGAYKTIYDALCQNKDPKQGFMVGYRLKNTVSEHGSVTRGVCSCEDGYLTKVTETYKIKVFDDGTIRDTEKDENGKLLDPEAVVSMNLWGFDPKIFDEMQDRFDKFLGGMLDGDIKSEYVLPVFVDELLKEDKLAIQVLRSNDKWFGITYKEDRPVVREELKKLHDQGSYPKSLRELK